MPPNLKNLSYGTVQDSMSLGSRLLISYKNQTSLVFSASCVLKTLASLPIARNGPLLDQSVPRMLMTRMGQLMSLKKVMTPFPKQNTRLWSMEKHLPKRSILHIRAK